MNSVTVLFYQTSL